jgi:hypothetical protein
MQLSSHVLFVTASHYTMQFAISSSVIFAWWDSTLPGVRPLTLCTVLYCTVLSVSRLTRNLLKFLMYSGNAGSWDWLTAPAPALVSTTAPSSSSCLTGHSHSSDMSSSTSTYNENSMYYPLAPLPRNGYSDLSRGRMRSYADSLLNSPGECFDYAVVRTRKLLRADLNAIIVDLCEGE